MGQLRGSSPGLIQNSIPADEAVFYENEASREIERLASLTSIENVASVSSSLSFAGLARVFRTRAYDKFPDPRRLWLAATFDCLAEYEALKFLAPLRGRIVLQLGGNGAEAVKFMMAGAKVAHLVSPVESELRCGTELARLCGVEIQCKLGLAEDIPYPDHSFDIIYSSGCAHHFETQRAFPEIARVLRPSGRFAAVEPWRAPFYSLGIHIFGKREKEVNCRPLTRERIGDLSDWFSFHELRQHGTFLRYPMIALAKLGVMIPLSVAWWLFSIDDGLSSLLHVRSYGSCAAILAEK
jgi:SAM-dependent methyltransferase